MNLPKSSNTYDARDQDNLRTAIAQADKANMKKNTDIEMGKARFFMRSPNSSRWIIAVADDGTLSATPA
jgi:hypothetical protein